MPVGGQETSEERVRKDAMWFQKHWYDVASSRGTRLAESNYCLRIETPCCEFQSNRQIHQASMLRHVACKPIRSGPVFSHASPRPFRRLSSTPLASRSVSDAVDTFCTDYSYPFHEIFQHIHEYTHLPMALSIPLGVVLMRAFLIPFRVQRVRQDKDRRLAYPLLLMQSRIVDRWGDLKLAASSTENTVEIQDWKQKEFAIRRARIENQYKHARPVRYEFFNTRRSLADPIAGLLLLCNTSTLAYFSIHQSTLVNLSSGPVNYSVLLCGGLFAMLITNKAYYRSKIPLSPKTGYPSIPTTKQFSLFSWSEGEAEILRRYLIPLFGVCILPFFPDAVTLCVFSNSAYTFLERHTLNYLVKMPEGVEDHDLREAAQLVTIVRTKD